MFDTDADCYIVCPVVSQGPDGPVWVPEGRTTPVVSYTDMEGVLSLTAFLGHHGQAERFRTVATGTVLAGPPGKSAGAIIVGGPRPNPMTREILPTLDCRFEFVYSKEDPRAPALIRDTVSGRDYERDCPPDADYALVVKDDDGLRTYIVLAGIGARSTRAACEYFAQDLDIELPRRRRYSCVIRSSLADPLRRPTKEVDDQES